MKKTSKLVSLGLVLLLLVLVVGAGTFAYGPELQGRIRAVRNSGKLSQLPQYSRVVSPRVAPAQVAVKTSRASLKRFQNLLTSCLEDEPSTAFDGRYVCPTENGLPQADCDREADYMHEALVDAFEQAATNYSGSPKSFYDIWNLDGIDVTVVSSEKIYTGMGVPNSHNSLFFHFGDSTQELASLPSDTANRFNYADYQLTCHGSTSGDFSEGTFSATQYVSPNPSSEDLDGARSFVVQMYMPAAAYDASKVSPYTASGSAYQPSYTYAYYNLSLRFAYFPHTLTSKFEHISFNTNNPSYDFSKPFKIPTTFIKDIRNADSILRGRVISYNPYLNNMAYLTLGYPERIEFEYFPAR